MNKVGVDSGSRNTQAGTGSADTEALPETARAV